MKLSANRRIFIHEWCAKTDFLLYAERRSCGGHRWNYSFKEAMNEGELLGVQKMRAAARRPSSARPRGLSRRNEREADGRTGGTSAGRARWVVAGSLCGGRIQGTYAQKLNNCWKCDFMNAVKKEEESTQHGFSHTLLGMERTSEKMRSGTHLLDSEHHPRPAIDQGEGTPPGSPSHAILSPLREVNIRKRRDKRGGAKQ